MSCRSGQSGKTRAQYSLGEYSWFLLLVGFFCLFVCFSTLVVFYGKVWLFLVYVNVSSKTWRFSWSVLSVRCSKLGTVWIIIKYNLSGWWGPWSRWMVMLWTWQNYAESWSLLLPCWMWCIQMRPGKFKPTARKYSAFRFFFIFFTFLRFALFCPLS